MNNDLPEGCSYGEFGHKCYQNDNGDWLWTEDNTPCSVKKACQKCGLFPMENGNDPCLGDLPGVVGACCGHGLKPPQGYILFENGVRILLKNSVILTAEENKKLEDDELNIDDISTRYFSQEEVDNLLRRQREICCERMDEWCSYNNLQKSGHIVLYTPRPDYDVI